MNDSAGLILRIGLGVMFLAHGLQLAFGLFGGPGAEGFSKVLSTMGFTPAITWSYLAGYTCVIGGSLLLIGLWVRVAILPLMIFMLVAMIKVHLKNGFFLGSGGYEYNFIIIIALIALFMIGPGKYGITKKI